MADFIRWTIFVFVGLPIIAALIYLLVNLWWALIIDPIGQFLHLWGPDE